MENLVVVVKVALAPRQPVTAMCTTSGSVSKVQFGSFVRSWLDTHAASGSPPGSLAFAKSGSPSRASVARAENWMTADSVISVDGGSLLAGAFVRGFWAVAVSVRLVKVAFGLPGQSDMDVSSTPISSIRSAASVRRSSSVQLFGHVAEGFRAFRSSFQLGKFAHGAPCMTKCMTNQGPGTTY
jgi:hypothetical protein